MQSHANPAEMLAKPMQILCRSYAFLLQFLCTSCANPMQFLGKSYAKPMQVLCKYQQHPIQILSKSYANPVQVLQNPMQTRSISYGDASKAFACSFQILHKYQEIQCKTLTMLCKSQTNLWNP